MCGEGVVRRGEGCLLEFLFVGGGGKWGLNQSFV
jgi:hypothetical protein